MRLLPLLAGGAFESGSRYLVAVWVAGRVGVAFPWSALTVNLLGSFFIVLIAILSDKVGGVGPQPRVFLVVGVLGGFTTFSGFSLEVLRLVEADQYPLAMLCIACSIALALTAATLGIIAGRALGR